MTHDEFEPSRDPVLGAWLARADAPAPSAPELDRLAGRIAAAARDRAVPAFRLRAARWARYAVPLAAAAGVAALLLTRAGDSTDDLDAYAAEEPAAAVAAALRRPDAESYLMNVAFGGYDAVWATQLGGGTR